MSTNSVRAITRASATLGAISAGILMTGAGAQAADLNWNTFGNSGILNGNQVYLPVQVPVNVCGVAVGVLGDANAGCTGGATAVHHPDSFVSNWNSGLNSGILNGNQVAAIVQVPVNICGVAVGVLGDASAWCEGGASANIGDKGGKNHHPNPHYPRDAKAAAQAKAGAGTASGASTAAATSKAKKATIKRESLPLGGLANLGSILPLGDIAGGLLGDSKGADQATAMRHGYPGNGGGNGHHSGGCKLNWNTFGNSGIGNGNQVFAPIQVPIDVSGNAVAVGGNANAWSVGGATATAC